MRNVLVLASAGARQAGEDPVLLAVQTLRRLPVSVRSRVSATLLRRQPDGPTVASSLAHYLADHHDDARRDLSNIAPTGRVARRVAAELTVALAGDVAAEAPPSLRARAAWQHGDLTEALSIARAAPGRAMRRYTRRLESEFAMLTPGWHLDAGRPSLESTEAAGLPKPTRIPGAPGSESQPSGIRVLHVLTNSLPWTQSGYSLRSHSVLTAQAREGLAVEAMTRAGYPVIVGLPQARDVDTVDGVTYRRVLPARLAATAAGRLEQLADAVVRHAATFHPCVLHTTTHYPNAIVVQAAAQRLGVPWVYEVRGQLEKTWLAGRPAGQQAAAALSERYLMARAREAELAASADHVVTLSRSLRDDLASRGVDRESITLVPNAVDSALLALGGQKTSPAEARASLGLPADGFWVGTVSSIVDYEGLDVLLSAVAALRAAGVDARCAIVGDGVARPGLQRLAVKLGIDDVAHFPGRVARDEAIQWHRALDVFVVPRRDTEVCRTVTPLKPIEAMALGRPVVASNLPALAEVVAEPETGPTGLLVTPGAVDDLAATLHQFSADTSLAQRLGANGQTFAGTRTWEAQAETYRSIYERFGDPW